MELIKNIKKELEELEVLLSKEKASPIEVKQKNVNKYILSKDEIDISKLNEENERTIFNGSGYYSFVMENINTNLGWIYFVNNIDYKVDNEHKYFICKFFLSDQNKSIIVNCDNYQKDIYTPLTKIYLELNPTIILGQDENDKLSCIEFKKYELKLKTVYHDQYNVDFRDLLKCLKHYQINTPK